MRTTIAIFVLVIIVVIWAGLTESERLGNEGEMDVNHVQSPSAG